MGNAAGLLTSVPENWSMLIYMVLIYSGKLPVIYH
jgi:hypothetical protein